MIYEMKLAGDGVLLRDTNVSPAWCKGVVDENDVVYPSQLAAGHARRLAPSEVSRSIRHGIPLPKGAAFRLATEKEVLKSLPTKPFTESDQDHARRTANTASKKRQSKKARAVAKGQITKKAKKTAPTKKKAVKTPKVRAAKTIEIVGQLQHKDAKAPLFMGHVFPNGFTLVGSPLDLTFVLSAARKDDLPAIIRDRCEWE